MDTPTKIRYLLLALAGIASVAVGIGAGWRLSESERWPMQAFLIGAMVPYVLIVIGMLAIRAIFKYRSVRIPVDVLSVLSWGLIVAIYGSVWISPPDLSIPSNAEARGAITLFSWGMTILLFVAFLVLTVYGFILKAIESSQRARKQ